MGGRVRARWAARRTGAGPAAARGDVLGGTVELVDAAADLLVLGAAGRCRNALTVADGRLGRLLRRAATARGLGSGLGVFAIGATSVLATAVGIAAIGEEFSNAHLLLTMPVMQTMSPGFAQRSESSSVVVPIRSSTLSTPSGYTCRTASAINPVSTNTSSAPPSRSSLSRSGLRVVAATEAPWLFAIAAAASPTDVVPPRMSRRSPFCKRSDLNSELHAVCNISGIAPSVSQGSFVFIACTCLAGTQVY